MHEQISFIHGEKTELLLALILRIFWRSRIFPFIIIVVLYILYFSLLIPYILSYHFTTTASKAQRNLYRSVILYSRMHLFSIIFSFILLYTSLSFCHCTIWLFAICISTSCFEGYQVVYTIWRLWIASLLLMYLRVVIDLSTMAFTDEVFFSSYRSSIKNCLIAHFCFGDKYAINEFRVFGITFASSSILTLFLKWTHLPELL